MKKELFSTQNTGLAAALISCGYRMVESRKMDNEVLFYFDKDETIEEDAGDYNTGKLKVDALTFYLEVKKLRRIIGAHYRIAEEVGYLKKETIERSEEELSKEKKRKNKDGFYSI
jgi:hypothetical protein